MSKRLETEEVIKAAKKWARDTREGTQRLLVAVSKLEEVERRDKAFTRGLSKKSLLKKTRSPDLTTVKGQRQSVRDQEVADADPCPKDWRKNRPPPPIIKPYKGWGKMGLKKGEERGKSGQRSARSKQPPASASRVRPPTRNQLRCLNLIRKGEHVYLGYAKTLEQRGWVTIQRVWSSKGVDRVTSYTCTLTQAGKEALKWAEMGQAGDPGDP